MNRHYMISVLVVFLVSSCKKKEDYYSVVKNRLEKVLIDDQKYRNPTYDPIKQKPIDEKNLAIVTKIIDSLGWLGKDKIGNDANLALFAVIQHANTLAVIEKYLHVMKEAAKKGDADKRQLAYMIDRVELANNRKQIYGTQYAVDEKGKVYFRNLMDSANVNSRRKSMNLYPIEDYIHKIDSSAGNRR